MGLTSDRLARTQPHSAAKENEVFLRILPSYIVQIGPKGLADVVDIFGGESKDSGDIDTAIEELPFQKPTKIGFQL